MAESARGGDLHLGSYQVSMVDKIGQGSFGVVYKGKHSLKGFLVAAKQCDLRSDKSGTDAMEEIKHFQHLRSHPHIVTLHDFHYKEKSFWLIMEYCDGGDLEYYFKTQKPLFNEQLNLMYQTASAINYMHSQASSIIHRDVKPGNILLTRYEGKAVVKVTDFGVSKMVDAPDPAKTMMYTTQAGSPGFMAPEFFINVKYDKSVDVFALGLVFLAMVKFKPGDTSLAPTAGAVLVPIGAQMAQFVSMKMPVPEFVPKHEQDSEGVAKLKSLITRMIKYEPKERCSMRQAENMLVEFGGTSPIHKPRDVVAKRPPTAAPSTRKPPTAKTEEPPVVRKKTSSIWKHEPIASTEVNSEGNTNDRPGSIRGKGFSFCMPSTSSSSNTSSKPTPDWVSAPATKPISKETTKSATPPSGAKIEWLSSAPVSKSPPPTPPLSEKPSKPTQNGTFKPAAATPPSAPWKEDDDDDIPEEEFESKEEVDTQHYMEESRKALEACAQPNNDTTTTATSEMTSVDALKSATAVGDLPKEIFVSKPGASSDSDSDGENDAYRAVKDALLAHTLSGLPDDVASRISGHHSLRRLGNRSNRQLDKFEVGDQVIIIDDTEKLRELQDGYGGFPSGMEKYCGKLGVVKEKVMRRMLKVIHDDGQSLHYNPEACVRTGEKPFDSEQLSSFDVEDERVRTIRARFRRYDVVELPEDEELVRCLQQNIGWKSTMAKSLGVKGMVNRVDRDGDVFVEFINGQDWLLNPEVLIPVDMSEKSVEPGDFVVVVGEHQQAKTLQDTIGTWNEEMGEKLGHSGVVSSVTDNTVTVDMGRACITWHQHLVKLVAKGEELMKAVLKRNGPSLVSTMS